MLFTKRANNVILKNINNIYYSSRTNLIHKLEVINSEDKIWKDGLHDYTSNFTEGVNVFMTSLKICIKKTKLINSIL